jgi:FKBP12-rapamycin complex-associated protein
MNLVCEAVRAFFNAIRLGNRSTYDIDRKGYLLQDVLRVLTLWFQYGSDPDVAAAVAAGFASVPVHTWVRVTPQIIARLNTRHPRVGTSVQALLMRVGELFPQSVIYRLTVHATWAEQRVGVDDSDRIRREAAAAIIAHLRSYDPRHRLLVKQAKDVAAELVRVAILWDEYWLQA